MNLEYMRCTVIYNYVHVHVLVLGIFPRAMLKYTIRNSGLFQTGFYKALNGHR